VPARVTNQDRSNSGVFLMGRCEVQVLDSCTDDDYATNKTYTDGQGNCMRKARIPVFQNGVCVRNNQEIEGASAHGTKARYGTHATDRLSCGIMAIRSRTATSDLVSCLRSPTWSSDPVGQCHPPSLTL
jgi:hypothetical protein